MSKLNPEGLKEAEYVRHVFRATVPNDTTINDVLKPDFWAHVAAKLHNTDIIEVCPEDESWFAQLIVRSASRLHAKCAVLRHQSFNADKKTAEPEGPFSIKHNGPKAKWCVIRRVDKALVKEGFASKEEAAKWTEDNQADLLA